MYFSDQIPLHKLLYTKPLKVAPSRAIDNWQLYAAAPKISIKTSGVIDVLVPVRLLRRWNPAFGWSDKKHDVQARRDEDDTAIRCTQGNCEQGKDAKLPKTRLKAPVLNIVTEIRLSCAEYVPRTISHLLPATRHGRPFAGKFQGD